MLVTIEQWSPRKLVFHTSKQLRGSGNVFLDFGTPNADAEQLRSILVAQIIKVLDERKPTVREAEALTSIAAADFSRAR